MGSNERYPGHYNRRSKSQQFYFRAARTGSKGSRTSRGMLDFQSSEHFETRVYFRACVPEQRLAGGGTQLICWSCLDRGALTRPKKPGANTHA